MNLLSRNQGNLMALLLAAVAIAWVGSSGSGLDRAVYAGPEIDVPQARALIDAGAVVLDVRGTRQYEHRHIPGAVLVPLADLEDAVPAAIATARDKQVIVYCNEGQGHGPRAAHLLRQSGFTQVLNLRSGIEGWAAAGQPLAHGKT